MIFSSSSLVCLLLTATFSPQRAIAAPLAESVSISAAIATPTQPYTAPTVSPTTALQLAVQKCATRMNEVLPPFIPTGFKYSGVSRQYYVKAEEVAWDYIPSKWDNMRGVPIADSPASDGADYAFSNNSIGSKYVKSLFRGYTDATYSTQSLQPDYLGFQGPLMRAEVGDMVEVMVYNGLSAPDHSVSMHSMGLHYSPNSEGATYYRGSNENGTAISFTGNSIPHEECFVYKWLITNSSAPVPTQPSKLWTYHGDLNLFSDVHSGLVGPFIVYRTGEMEKVMQTTKEFVLFFATTDEFDSYYLNQNVATYEPSATFSASVGAPAATPTSSANATIWSPILTDLPPVGANASLAQSFTAINGFAFAAMPTLEICQDDLVVFHLYSYGSFNDGFHVAHWHGNNIITPEGYNSATLSLLPGTMKTVTMYAQNVGVWQLLCHVAAHWQAGMQANYHIAATGTGMC